MAALRVERGLDPKDSNFDLYREVTGEMYETADAETRAQFEAEAEAFNAKIKGLPTADEIYKYVDLLSHRLSKH